MVRKFIVLSALASMLLVAAGCRHKVQNPLANIDSKQPDKNLYDRAIDSMKKAHYQEARTLLETLINTYPDSEFIARAKLAVGDAWYNEGGTAAWQQAEVEYKDFQTFFPNLPEASEAQLKVARIHYRQMEKPDRDFAQAVRAAEEYRALIQNYPDSPLVPEAKQRLREVQEVLAERQYRIAHFYYLRDNLAAAQARLTSLVDSYPLYSSVDEALFELGSLYEREAASMRKQKMTEATKEKMAAMFQKRAIEAYTRIITRYPAMNRAEDARKRLIALNAPVPTPTEQAMAESKAEEASRGKLSMTQDIMSNFSKRPPVVRATKVGDPNLEDEKVASAPAMLKELDTQIASLSQTGQQSVGLQPVASGTGAAPGANQAPPSTKATPSGEGAPPPAPPSQVNEVQKADDAQPAQAGQQGASDQDKQESTSKKKGKKGLRKLIPF